VSLPVSARQVSQCAYRRVPRTAAALPSGVPPPERARQRVGPKVVRLLHSTIWLQVQGNDLRHAPPLPFGLWPRQAASTRTRPSADTKSFAPHWHFFCFIKIRTVLLTCAVILAEPPRLITRAAIWYNSRCSAGNCGICSLTYRSVVSRADGRHLVRIDGVSLS